MRVQTSMSQLSISCTARSCSCVGSLLLLSLRISRGSPLSAWRFESLPPPPQANHRLSKVVNQEERMMLEPRASLHSSPWCAADRCRLYTGTIVLSRAPWCLEVQFSKVAWLPDLRVSLFRTCVPPPERTRQAKCSIVAHAIGRWSEGALKPEKTVPKQSCLPALLEMA